jgi:predicted metallo-beta-lactamase superfamily hydrolase
VRVIPLAAESLGVRSMATFVEAAGVRLLIDPGATLAPNRFNLPPAEEEWEALRRANDRISAYARRAAVVFVSHYHDDHFRSDPASYTGLRVLLKDPRRMVQGLQARRAGELWKALQGVARVQAADGLVERDGPVTLEVSRPLPHGVEGTALGYVVALTVVDHAERERFVFASDLQGPLSPVAAAWLGRQRPTLVYLSGPPSYLEHELGSAAVAAAIERLRALVDSTGCRVIMDHHALRDAHWPERFGPLFETGRVTTAAAWAGVADTPLEARRRELWARARKPAARAPGPRGSMSRVTPGRSDRHTAKGGHAR